MRSEKVIVMGPQDVAAMRSAAKDAEVAYFNAKVGALEFVAEEMRNTGKEYTASELSAMSGLTSGEIAAQLGGWCRAGRRAGASRDTIQTRITFAENKYVRVMPDGEINPDQTITVRRKQAKYQIRLSGKR